MPGGLLGDRPLTYTDLFQYMQNDPRLSEARGLLPAPQGPSGFGDHNQIWRDMANAMETFGILPSIRTQDRWFGREPTPSTRVSQGWGDMQAILPWISNNLRAAGR